MAVTKPRRTGLPLDRTTLLGVPMAFGLVLLGQWLEGGRLGSVLQLTAALIVFGGTLGAVLVSFPMADIQAAAKALREVVRDRPESDKAAIEQISRNLAQKGNRFSALVVEIVKSDPFQKRRGKKG